MTPGHLRQGRPERAGGLRPAHPADHRGDHRGHRGVSRSRAWAASGRGAAVSDLLALAEALVAQASPASRSRSTWPGATTPRCAPTTARSSRLSSATSAGVGIRVLLAGDGEAGQPGGLRLGRVARRGPGRRRRWPRPGTTPPTPPPTPTWPWPCPTGWPPAELDLWDPAFAATPTDHKVELALALERQVRGADPRIRQVDSADYGDGSVEVALASTTGIRATTRRTCAFLSVSAIAGEGADTQTGSGFSVGRAPRRPRPRPGGGRRGRAGDPHARRRQGPVGPAAPWSSTPGWSPPCSR